MTVPSELPTIAVIGGTGNEGRGLVFRWSRAGCRVIIGSRSIDRAVAVAKEITTRLQGTSSTLGMSNLDATVHAGIAVLAVPYAVHNLMLELIKPALQGKLLIDVTVPINPGSKTNAVIPFAGSAAQEARQILGEDVEVAAAFHSISHTLLDSEATIDSDVLVCGTSQHARAETLKLVTAAGLRGWDAGTLQNSSVLEGLASVLIQINKRYGSKHAGIRITGVQPG
jgi:NADPH-dependent F420 reductase